MNRLFQIVVYVPTAAAQAVKTALFQAGAGKIGNYDSCAWEIEGRGQFRPLPGSSPHIGSENKIEIVPELRIELVCEESCLRGAVQAMKKAHPY